MDNADEAAQPLECREPTLTDLVELCRLLNTAGARYVVVDGFAIRAAGFIRNTMDVDLLVDTSPENEARLQTALGRLPDNAIHELQLGDLDRHGVIRVADEFCVDLKRAAV